MRFSFLGWGIGAMVLLCAIACTPKRQTVVIDPIPIVTLTTTNIPLDTASNPTPMSSFVECKPVVMVERTGCNGECSVYEARVLSDGRATYIGRKYVPKIGTYEAKLDTTGLQSILALAEQIHFWQLAPYYPVDQTHKIPDLPSTITMLNYQGRQKLITNQYDGPVALRRWEKQLDQFFEQLEWKKITVLSSE